MAVAEAEVKVSGAKKEKKLTEELLDEYAAELRKLTAALKSYKPLLNTGAPHTDMAAVATQFTTLADVEQKLLVTTRKELAAAKVDPKTPPPPPGEKK